MPLKDRDFVNVRHWFWAKDGNEAIILSQSVTLPVSVKGDSFNPPQANRNKTKQTNKNKLPIYFATAIPTHLL